MTSWSKRRLSVRARRIAPSGGCLQPGNRRSPSRCLGDVLLVFAALLAVMPAPARAQSVTQSATYQVTFEGTWTTGVTPGGVISSAHFSPLIGAVHDGGVVFWSRGGTASAGIEEVAETGRTATFRSEINASPNAVTVVEQGLPNGPTPTATVDVTLTTTHPLVTLVAMIAPSPDWFVGVSGLSLLDARGQWRPRQQVDLFPYDAGTEEGTEFALDNPATSPRETITSIRGTGKFSNEPIARLTFELQDLQLPSAPTNLSALPGNEQAMLSWTAPDNSPISGHEYRYKTTGNYPATWTAIADSGPDGANYESFTVTRLTNGTEHTFEVRASNPRGSGQSSNEATVTPSAPTVLESVVTIAAGPSPVVEGAPALFTLTRTAVEAALTVEVRVTETGAAIGGSLPTAVSFEAGSATAALPIATTDDEVSGPDSEITVTVVDGPGYAVGAASAATVRVTNNDPPSTAIALSLDRDRVVEGAGATPVTVTASLDGSVRTEDTAVTVSVSGSGAAGVVGFASVAAFDVTISAGAAQGTGTFTVTPEDDAVDEMDERIDVRGTSSLEVRAAALILADDDAPSTTIVLSLDRTQVAEDAGATPVTVTATLGQSARTEDTVVMVSVSGSGAPGVVDFGAVEAFEVTIPAAASSGTGTFTVTPEDDAVDEMDERVDVRGESTLVVQPAALILADDDDPSTSIALSLDRERMAEDAGVATVAVTATLDESARTVDTMVQVEVSGSGGSGVVGFEAVEAFEVTIPATMVSGAGTFVLTPLNDMAAAGDETVRVSGTSDLPVTAATLILTDDDDASMATAWLARFGRTSASHVVDAVAERLRGAQGRRTHVTAGGQRLFGGSGGDGGLATLAQGLFGAAVPAGGGLSMGGLALGGQRLFGTAGRAGPRPAGGIAMGVTPLSVQTVGALGSDAHGRALPGAALSWDRFRSMRGRDLLSQSSFHTSSAQDADSGDAAGRGARWAAWGRGAVTRFDGGEGALSLDGDVVTGTAGVDYAQGRLLAGLAVAHSVGDGTFTAPGIGVAAANAGELGLPVPQIFRLDL